MASAARPRPSRRRGLCVAACVQVAEADSAELCSAFTEAEGGPPTPLEEPLSREMREALTRGDEGEEAGDEGALANGASSQGKRQIAGILRQGRFAGAAPGTPGALEGGGTPISPDVDCLSPNALMSPTNWATGAGIDVDELLKIVDNRPEQAVQEARSALHDPTSITTATATSTASTTATATTASSSTA